uniref:Uncharacterized protein n=1 Tax=Siphoviridae sp. ctZHD14 TaxID=2827891 RepID=A0A8S5SXD9_9CAUD|nr:MAG TPA: hypothetical protein [Siphoviridae sp. ctZHD14]
MLRTLLNIRGRTTLRFCPFFYLYLGIYLEI